MRRIVDVEVRSHLGLVAHEADVAVRDAHPIQPLDGVSYGGGVTPVDVEPVGDDTDPHAGIGEPPEGLGRSGDHRHPAQHPVLGDGQAVEALELVGREAPLREVP